MFTPPSKKEDSLRKVVAPLLLTVALFIFSYFTIQEATSVNYPFTLDPPYHMTLAQAMDAESPFSTSISTYDGGVVTTKYATLMRVLTVAIHEITSLNYIHIYQIFGIATRIFSALIIFLICKRLTKSAIISTTAAVLFLGAKYVIFRAIITFPENLAIPFHLLIFYEVSRSIETKKIHYTLPIYVAGAALVHFRSMVVPVLLLAFLACYIIWEKFKLYRKRRSQGEFPIKNFIIVVLIFGLLALPVVVDTVKIFPVYLKGNVGASATFAVNTENNARYTPPSFNTYVGNVGYPLVLFSILGAVFLLLKQDKKPKELLVLIWFVFALVLSQGTRFELHVPTDRMIIYLTIPAVLSSAYALKFIFDVSDKRRFLSMGIIFLSLILMITTATQVSGWKAFKDHEISQVGWLNEHIRAEENHVLLVSGVSYLNLGFNQFDALETKGDTYANLIDENTLDTDAVRRLYQNKHVFFAVNHDNSAILVPSESLRLFESSSSIVYDLGIQ